MSRFENVSCSQCGEDFGPGESGFSRCQDHDFVLRDSSGRVVLSITHIGDGPVYGPVYQIRTPQSFITIDIAEMAGLRNWLERKIGCLYQDSSDDDVPETVDLYRG